jgi:hypothetical protein
MAAWTPASPVDANAASRGDQAGRHGIGVTRLCLRRRGQSGAAAAAFRLLPQKGEPATPSAAHPSGAAAWFPPSQQRGGDGGGGLPRKWPSGASGLLALSAPENPATSLNAGACVDAPRSSAGQLSNEADPRCALGL